MLSGNSKTFLAVTYTCMLNGSIAQKQILKLIHTCVGKHQCWIILDHQWCRRHCFMLFAFKKLNEGFTNLLSVHNLVFLFYKYFSKIFLSLGSRCIWGANLTKIWARPNLSSTKKHSSTKE